MAVCTDTHCPSSISPSTSRVSSFRHDRAIHLVCLNPTGIHATDRDPAVIGALLGTQNGRDVEIVNTFELAASEDGATVDQDFLLDRKEQCATISVALVYRAYASHR